MGNGIPTLALARARARLTQAQLAAKAGVARQTIERIELGYSIPRLTTKVLIAEALDIPLEVLFPEEAA